MAGDPGDDLSSMHGFDAVVYGEVVGRFELRVEQRIVGCRDVGFVSVLNKERLGMRHGRISGVFSATLRRRKNC